MAGCVPWPAGCRSLPLGVSLKPRGLLLELVNGRHSLADLVGCRLTALSRLSAGRHPLRLSWQHMAGRLKHRCGVLPALEAGGDGGWLPLRPEQVVSRSVQGAFLRV